MKVNFSLEPWLDSAQVIDYLHESSGVELTHQALLRLFNPEHHVAYIDCRFAAGLVYQQQLFARRIKGAGYCELLQADEIHLGTNSASEQPLLSVGGKAVVLGSAWVYSTAGGPPTLEEGIWQIDLGRLNKPLHFKPADVEHLAARISESQRSHLVRRAAR
jgi:hypothetical protein